MPEPLTSAVEQVIEQIPSGLFVLTTAHDGLRSGVLARWVQRCATEPPMVVVAIPKGQPVEPLLINSRGFALCMIESDDRLLLRKFAQTPDRADDPFVAISSCDAPSGSPIIDRAICYIDCEVARLVELESDHRLCVGLVHAAGMLHPDHGDRMNGQPG